MEAKVAKFSASRNALQLSLNAQASAVAEAGAVFEAEWKDLKGADQELDQKLAANGITVDGSAFVLDVVRLNVGGMAVRVSLPALMKLKKSSKATWNLGDLFRVGWGNRLPKDADGRFVLDESSTCFDHLVQTLRLGATNVDDGFVNDVLPAAEKQHVRYLSRTLGLRAPSKCITEPWNCFAVPEESTLLSVAEFRMLAVDLTRWCSAEVCGMELLYRGSRDGFTADAFRARCGEHVPSTVSLFHVAHDAAAYGGDRFESVPGGFSDVAWTEVPDTARLVTSTKAFIFCAARKIGGNDTGVPSAKYKLRKGHQRSAVTMGKNLGPMFGAGDLGMTFGAGNLPSALSIGNHSYEVGGSGDRSAFYERSSNHEFLDVEVYRVSTCSAETPANPTADATSLGNVCDEAVATSLAEERAALNAAHAEQARTEARVAAALHALDQVYGPRVASGNVDEVVDISVRGTRITTLRSTLQLCPPDSFIALWLTKDKDVDDHGRWVLDCNPAMFSKILDVLRMKKRAGWANDNKEKKKGGGGRDVPVGVAVSEGDEADFQELVNQFFPGCEEFITSFVEAR